MGQLQTLGNRVRIRRADGTYIEGQFWADGPTEGTVWLALDTGKFALANTRTRNVYATDASGNTRTCIGKVAA